MCPISFHVLIKTSTSEGIVILLTRLGRASIKPLDCPVMNKAICLFVFNETLLEIKSSITDILLYNARNDTEYSSALAKTISFI